MAENKNYPFLIYETASMGVPRKPLDVMLKEYRERQMKKEDEQDDVIKWWADQEQNNEKI